MVIVHVLILYKRFVNATRHDFYTHVRVKKLLFLVIGYETQLYQATRHGSLTKDEEACLMDPLVSPVSRTADRTLNQFSKLYAL